MKMYKKTQNKWPFLVSFYINTNVDNVQVDNIISKYDVTRGGTKREIKKRRY